MYFFKSEICYREPHWGRNVRVKVLGDSANQAQTYRLNCSQRHLTNGPSADRNSEQVIVFGRCTKPR